MHWPKIIYCISCISSIKTNLSLQWDAHDIHTRPGTLELDAAGSRAALPIKLWDFFAKWMGNDQNLPEEGTRRHRRTRREEKWHSNVLKIIADNARDSGAHNISTERESYRRPGLQLKKLETWLRLPHSFIYHLTYVVFSLFLFSLQQNENNFATSLVYSAVLQFGKLNIPTICFSLFFFFLNVENMFYLI